MTKPVHVGAIVSAPWLGASFWTFVASCLRTEAERRHLTLSKYAALSVEEQATHVDQLLAGGVQAIIMKPMGTAEPVLLAALGRAAAAGVPVVTLDSLIDHRAVVATVGTDNASAMAQSADHLFGLLNGTGKMVYFGGDDRMPMGAVRNRSFHQWLLAHPGIEVVHEVHVDWITPMSRRAFGADCMRRVLQAVPRFDALISASDDAALGALDALRAAGLPMPLIMGFDGLPEALFEVSTGGMTGTMLQSAEGIAQAAIDLALRAITHEPFPRVVHVGTTLVTAANAEKVALESLQVMPKLVDDLSESHAIQRELQQQVIAKQRKILSAVAATSVALNRIREREQMVSELVTVLVRDFGLLSAQVVCAAIDAKTSSRASRYHACVQGRHSELVTDEAGLRSLEAGPPIGAALLLPLLASDRALGLLDLRAGQASTFDDETVEILGAIAHQIAIAFENASLYEETVRLAQSELLTARRAGMAEIATNVLHNVGNILNSVNVSAGLVSARLRASKSKGLSQAMQLMDEHLADLGHFLTQDAKGRLLPGYLSKLALALALERQEVIEELGHLSTSVDHIKNVVATQQSYAGNSSVLEPVQLGDLVEDALRMNDDSLARHRVTVVKEFAPVPLAQLDKTRVMQILVNLISNAKQAMEGVNHAEQRLTLQVDVAGSNLRLRVKDEGAGITSENLTRIFAHGFTTRKAGHGFGLHSCALAATQMGGTLTAHSDGPGKGAVFTLEIPMEQSAT